MNVNGSRARTKLYTTRTWSWWLVTSIDAVVQKNMHDCRATVSACEATCIHACLNLAKQPFTAAGCHVQCHWYGTCTLSKYGHSHTVSPKLGNVLLHPLEGQSLVLMAQCMSEGRNTRDVHGQVKKAGTVHFNQYAISVQTKFIIMPLYWISLQNYIILKMYFLTQNILLDSWYPMFSYVCHQHPPQHPHVTLLHALMGIIYTLLTWIP